MRSSFITKATFFAALLGMVIFFSVNSHSIRIETNLNDLNPSNQNDQNLKFATDSLLEDVSHRFVIVIKGTREDQLVEAGKTFQRELNKISNLQVLSNSESQSQYLSTLSPYRFGLLTEAQQQLIDEKSAEDLADVALRKLYQLGDGVRLIPFEQDPLGLFSNYLLTRFEELSNNTTTDLPATNLFESFNVYITDYPSNMAEQENLYLAITNIQDRVSEQFQVKILHSGIFFFAVDSAKSAKSDIQLIAIGSIVGILVLMLLVFRSLLPLFLTLTSIFIGVSFGVVISTLVFGSIHILTIVFGASLIGIVVDYSLHYFYHLLASDKVQQKATSHGSAFKKAMMLSVFTSLIGYGALALSDLVILKKVAVFSCSGLLMAWLGVMVLGPIVGKRPIVARQVLLIAIIQRIHQVFSRYPKVLGGMGLVLASFGALSLYFNDININDDPRLFFHVSPSLLKQEQEVSNLTQVYEPGRYLAVKGKTSEQIYQTLTTLYEKLGDDRVQLSSIIDWLPSPHQQKLSYERQKKIYKNDGALDVFYQRLGLEMKQSNAIKQYYSDANNRYLTFPDLLNNLPSLPPIWIEYNGDIISFVLIRKNSDFETIQMLSEDIPNIQYVNTLGTAVKALNDQRITGAKLLFVAYGLIALMLVLYYRRLSVVLLLLIPAVASTITLSSLALIGQSITVFHIMALFLVLGLGMDYIIFAKEMANQRAITQQAILLSAVTSLLSFGLLAFSSMPVVQAFGSTILVGNSINFIAAIGLFNKPTKGMENESVK